MKKTNKEVKSEKILDNEIQNTFNEESFEIMLDREDSDVENISDVKGDDNDGNQDDETE
ncbi:MAG: hypothetical protein MR606_05890 [Mollicutes bacterium]|nr:hypothetical protein [Mollicutes bacterium]